MVAERRLQCANRIRTGNAHGRRCNASPSRLADFFEDGVRAHLESMTLVRVQDDRCKLFPGYQLEYSARRLVPVLEAYDPGAAEDARAVFIGYARFSLRIRACVDFPRRPRDGGRVTQPRLDVDVS